MKFDSPLFDRIRVKPSQDRRPKTAGPGCDWHGCKGKGTHRAPKGRERENEYWRFCLEHVREYNHSYNFFAGMNDSAVMAYQKDALTGHRPTWKMGTGKGPMRPDAHAFGTHGDPFGLFSEGLKAEQQQRMRRQAEELEGRIAGRTHVIARTFDRVCGVLTQLGYLDGDTVTAEGRRLASLYTELDLLASECLRRGLWDALSPAELAACVSALTFESRRPPEDGSLPRLPGGQVRDVLPAMVRLWGELAGTEREHQLSFLREPDLGFAWNAHAWAQGRRLETVLETGLTPGDFVRAAKQLIDLLDQIASSAPAPVSAATAGGASRSLSATARAAIDAMRRGVVAYSAVAD